MKHLILIAPLALLGCEAANSLLPDNTDIAITDANGEIIREVRYDSNGLSCRKQRIPSSGGGTTIGGGSAAITIGVGETGGGYYYFGDGCAELGEY